MYARDHALSAILNQKTVESAKSMGLITVSGSESTLERSGQHILQELIGIVKLLEM